MSSVDYLRQFVGERLTAAAEEIFGVFHKTIVQYEEEIDRQRKLLDVVLKPEIKLRRIDVPQHNASKGEEALVVQQRQQLWNQDGNSSVDQMDPEPPQIEVEQEEVCYSQLGVKQENQDLLLISKYEENDQRDDQTGPSEESPDQFPFLDSVVSGANSELQQQQQQQQQLFNNLDGAESQGQNEGRCAGKKSFACDACGKVFRHIGNFTKHIESHTGDKPYTCNTCGKAFRVSDNLILHLRTHTGERPYVCKTCGKSFRVRFNLTSHLRVHTGERPFVCKTCGKTYRVNRDLVIHMRRAHTGERPYVCKMCGKYFFTSSNLSVHMRRAHTDERPFVCNTCGKGFIFISDLVIHNRVHTGERPYVCQICGKGFAASCQLIRHVRRHKDGLQHPSPSLVGRLPASCTVSL